MPHSNNREGSNVRLTTFFSAGLPQGVGGVRCLRRAQKVSRHARVLPFGCLLVTRVSLGSGSQLLRGGVQRTNAQSCIEPDKRCRGRHAPRCTRHTTCRRWSRSLGGPRQKLRSSRMESFDSVLVLKEKASSLDVFGNQAGYWWAAPKRMKSTMFRGRFFTRPAFLIRSLGRTLSIRPMLHGEAASSPSVSGENSKASANRSRNGAPTRKQTRAS
jgi:hypothetical protein